MNIQDLLHSKNNLNDLGNELIYFTRDNNLFTYHHHHHDQCSAQGQVLHCKLRLKLCPKTGLPLQNLGCSFTKDE